MELLFVWFAISVLLVSLMVGACYYRNRVYQILLLRHPVSDLATYWRRMNYQDFLTHNPKLPAEVHYVSVIHRASDRKVIEPLVPESWERFQTAFDATSVVLMSPN